MGNEVFFILSGSADVLMWGAQDKNYLDHKAMYNEISLMRSRNRSNMLNRTGTVVNPSLVSFGLIQHTDREALAQANKVAVMSRLKSNVDNPNVTLPDSTNAPEVVDEETGEDDLAKEIADKIIEEEKAPQ